MLRKSFIGLALVISFTSVTSRSQMAGYPQMSGEKLDGTVALDRALKASSLTFKGKPFYAIMEIGTVGEPYSGHIEVWWINATKYRFKISSPKFSQEKIVDGDRVKETNDGDYYPRWLEDFVLAIVNPVPMAENFRGHGGAVMIGAQMTRSCLRRDDRPNGITDQLTWGEVCFSGSEPRLSEVLTFNYAMTFRDWKGFDGQQIARTYETDVVSYKPLVGHLTTLEQLKKPDDSMFVIDSVTPVDQRISTSFVSTLQEESMLVKAPVIEWPPVREGKTEGYMIVYARTDRIGQVRETAKHNSDQPGLESFGIEQALNYKFKPLLVNGIPQQMEMPLVLHFSSKMVEPIPVLSVAEMAHQTISCRPDSIKPGLLPKGTTVTARVVVDENGGVIGLGLVNKCPVGCGLLAGPVESIKACKFAPYSMNGKPTVYKGDVELVAP